MDNHANVNGGHGKMPLSGRGFERERWRGISES